MMTVTPLQLPEIVPREEVEAWKASNPLPKGPVPEKVREFIEGLDAALPEFQQYQQEQWMISGRELQLCGLTTWGKETIDPWGMYRVNVPKMKLVLRKNTMTTIYLRKGKQGLIDYVKVQLKGHSLERILHHLHVNIFNEADPKWSKNYIELMAEIEKDKEKAAA